MNCLTSPDRYAMQPKAFPMGLPLTLEFGPLIDRDR